ncbi:unnamed protein product, partial [Pylaiella littoralis]
RSNNCLWTLLPWIGTTAPDRVFFRSSQVFQDLDGTPIVPSMTLTMGAAFSLVGVSHHLSIDSGSRNHFVTQMRSRGRWHTYECLDGGIATSSDDFDTSWNA